MIEAETSSFIFDEAIEFDLQDGDFEVFVENNLEPIETGGLIIGRIKKITKDFVTVDIGYKSEGQVPAAEFHNENGQLEAEIDTDTEIYVECLEDFDGQVVFSKEKARKLQIWGDVSKIHDEDRTISGVIIAKIKGGLAVDIGVRAFLPGSQVDLRPIRNLDKLLGERYDFKVLKYNQKRGNIVLSRRAILELDREDKRKNTLEQIEEGAVMKGHVKNITDYGVFVDLGGVDGLLHITDMTWGRINHPSEMFNVSDEIEVVVLSYNRENEKVSLGIKQIETNPWDQAKEKYPSGTQVSGKVVSLTNYGAFIELEAGVEGLIHVSEMSWTKKIRQPSGMLKMGEIVEAVVKELDFEKKRISLSIKDLQPNPWRNIANDVLVGSVIKGIVRNITDFGIFVGLEQGVDGLVHVTDISWSQRQKKTEALYQRGDQVDVKLLAIDVEKGRLSLGIKQLTPDPWETLENRTSVGEDVTGTIVHVADFGIFIEIEEGVEGLIHVSEIGNNVTKKKLQEMFIMGEEVTAKTIKIDSKERRLGLAISDSTMVAMSPKADSKEENSSPVGKVMEVPVEKSDTEKVTEVPVEKSEEHVAIESGKTPNNNPDSSEKKDSNINPNESESGEV